MSSPQFPTYGRGDDPDEPDQSERYAKPTPYGPSTYSQGGTPAPTQQPSDQPGQYGEQPVPGQPLGEQYGYSQPPAYRPGHPYGEPAHPQQHELPAYARDAGPAAPRDPRAARVVLFATIVAAVYGLLVISIQRVSLRDISQAPGSPLNHPLRTDVIDTIGQLLMLLVGAVAIGMWVRDLLSRRKVGRQPDPYELGGLALVAVSLIPILIWLVMVLSTGMGSVDESLHRLPTAYGWGGLGLIILAAGFALGYRELKPPVTNPVVRAAPERPPWG